MAKKKRKAPKRKGRRMGGSMKTGIMEAAKLLAGTTIGVLGGRFLNNSMSTQNGMMMGGLEVAAGVGIVYKGRNSNFLKGLGVGVAANGILYAAGSKGLNVLPASVGYGPPMQCGYRSMNGYRDVPKIGFPKPGNIGRINGVGNNREMAQNARMYAGIYN